MTDLPRRSGPPAWWAFGIIALAGMVRLLDLGGESYWFDEIWAVKQVREGLGDMLRGLAAEDVHPPLYPIVLWGWVRLVGEAEWATRLLSALAGTGAVAVTYGLGRDLLGRREGLVAAALLALNAYAVFYSQETRAYSLMLLLAVGATWALVRWWQAPTSRRRGAVYVLVAIPLAYVHVYGLFVLVAHGVWALWTAEALRVRMLVAGAAVLLAFSPWLPRLLGQVDRVQEGFWIEPLSLVDPVKWLWYWAGYNAPWALLLYPLAGLGLVRSAPAVRRLLALWMLVPVAIPVTLSVLGEPIFHHKYPIAVLGALHLAAARGLWALAPPRRSWAAAAAALCLVVGLPLTVYFKVDKEQYRELAQLARQDAEQGAVLVSERAMRHYIGYYLDPERVVWVDSDEEAAQIAHQATAKGAPVSYLLVHPDHHDREAVLEGLMTRQSEERLRSARLIRYR